VSRSSLALLVIFLVLLIDQLLKIYIKTSMQLGEEFGILGFSWARIHFTENEGMAFGMKLGGNYGKLLLTLFRIIAVGFIGYYLVSLIRKA
jgi:signal peptidase II